MRPQPIIFCRNVFIYFSHAGISRVLNMFARWMPSPAYLCVGASESLLRRTTTFELTEIGGSFMYLKADASRIASGRPDVEKAS
jgi:chemotaxis protein methyltransferase CheR